MLGGLDDVHFHLWHFAHARRLGIVEVSLLHHSIVQGDAITQHRRKREADGSFDLGGDDIGIHGDAGISSMLTIWRIGTLAYARSAS